MKNYLLVAILFVTGLSSAQITLENSYQSTSTNNFLSVVNLSNSGFKYSHLDLANKTVKLYNLNHSVWKTINLSVPNGYGIYGIYNISETLFNADALVEVAYSTYLWTFTSTPAVFNFQGRIVTENGTSILTIQDCANMSVTNVGSSYKLIATIDSAQKNTPKSFNVYSLVGSMPMITSVGENQPVDLSSSLYPNPSSERVRIDYTLPSGVTTGEVILFDINGSELKRYNIDNTFSSLDLNNNDLPSGTYLYKINAGNTSSNQKMILIK